MKRLNGYIFNKVKQLMQKERMHMRLHNNKTQFFYVLLDRPKL